VLKRNDPFLTHAMDSSELDLELTTYASKKLEVERMPPVDTLAAPKLCSTRYVPYFLVSPVCKEILVVTKQCHCGLPESIVLLYIIN